MKSIKNNIEIKKFIKSHIFDGVAVIKFLYWIKNYQKKLTELDAEKKLNFLEKIKIIYFQVLTQFLHQVQMVQLFIIEQIKSSNRIIKKDDIFYVIQAVNINMEQLILQEQQV